MDKYAELRATLDAATPGPWFVSETLGFAVASIAKLRVCSDVSTDVPPSIDAAYISAAHPETIRALLAERDKFFFALQEISHPEAVRGDATKIARAALAQEQGVKE